MCSNTRCCALTFGRWKLGNSGHILRHAVGPGGAAIRPGLLVHRELRRSNIKQCVKNGKCKKHSSNLLNVYNNWTNAYGDLINMASEVTVLLAEIRYIKGLAQCDMIHTVLFTLRAALSLPSCLGQKTTSVACSSEFVRRTRGSARFLSMSYQRVSLRLFSTHVEMKMKWKKKMKWKVMKSRLGSGPLIFPQQKLYAWLIMNHRPNALWCKIHNLNIMLRSISKHSEAVLQLPVSMYFAFIHQLKMHLVWIWKYYAKLQCSCKQIMVLWDSVVLNY